MPESLENQFISDLYTSLIHLSGAELGPVGPLNQVFDGAGNSTGLALSGKRVIVNNYIYPEGFETRDPIEWLDAFFPVGCLQLTFDDNNPTDRIAGTTWKRVAQGRFLVGTGTLTDKNDVQREFCPGGEEEEAQGKRGGSGDIAGQYEVTLTPDPAGTGTTQSSTRPGTTNSTLSFAEQVQARFELGRHLNVYSSNRFHRVTSSGMLEPFPTNQPVDEKENSPWLYALDLEFLRGSAANMSAEKRALYTVGDFAEQYQFKEMIGIWNGETRFVADVLVLLNPWLDFRPTSHVMSAKSPYEHAKDLGAIDIGEATAGDYETSHNETPIYSGDTSVLEGEEGAGDAVDSGPTGEDKAHNNILPSYGVYVWKRIA